MPYQDDGHLVTDKKSGSSFSWDTQAEWQAYQSQEHIAIPGNYIELAELTVPAAVEHHYPTDEGSGTTLTDNVGSLNGTINGATWIVLADAIGGQYLDMDGSEDRVSFGTDGFSFVVSSDYTITGFARIDDGSGNNPLAAYRDSNAGFTFRVNGGSLEFSHPGANTYTSSMSVPIGSWAFYGARYDASNNDLVLRINDTEESFNLGGMVDPSGQVSYFGHNNFSDYADGGFDDFTIQPVYLSDSDMDILRNRRSDV